MWGFLKVLINQASPWLGIKVLKLKMLPPKAVAFFSDIIRKTYQQRLASNQKRYLGYLVALKYCSPFFRPSFRREMQ